MKVKMNKLCQIYKFLTITHKDNFLNKLWEVKIKLGKKIITKDFLCQKSCKILMGKLKKIHRSRF